jgi:NTP pyrophosphatase (non-canonical NTP hydrolase)
MNDDTAALTFKRFSEANRARCESSHGFNHNLTSWDTSDWFLAILGELGEAANVGKKLNRVRDGITGNKQTPDELRAKLKRELGDVFVYLDLTAQAHGFHLIDAVIDVFDSKSEEIGYPVRLR